MSAQRVFISHSAKEPYADRFLKTLSKTLTTAGFDVLVDRERLNQGMIWRDDLYSWMGLCHAAIILLSESAVREGSVWVPRECSILLWRRALDPDFLIIPVYLGSVIPESLKSGNFADLRLEDVQAAPQGAPNRVVKAICQRLKKLKQRNDPTPLERVAEQIAFLLKDVPGDVVSRIAANLQVDLGRWTPTANPYFTLALKLSQVNLKQAIAEIENLVAYLDGSTTDRLLALVAPSWVDLCAARWVADCARRDPRPALILNAKSFFSANMYVRRASCQPHKTSWPVFHPSGIHGEKPVAELADEIENCLIHGFGITPDPIDQRGLKERMKNVLRIRHKQGKPVFIVLQFSPELANILPKLQAALPLLTFFLLSGDDFPNPDHLGPAINRMLEPRLAPGVEQQAQADYDYARSVITSGY